MAIAFPNMDPVALSLGPVQIHWYALAYVAGFLLGWVVARWICRLDQNRFRPNETDIEDFMTWAILGILLGGRLGYVLFYNLPVYMDNPTEALKIWHGGMAWHGALIGVITVTALFAKIKKVEFFRLTDMFATAAPIGFFLGRIANFVNGELFGRVTDVSWGIIFPRGGDLPRHPSQLYQATLEGAALFIVMMLMIRNEKIRNCPGIVSSVFLVLYGCFRFIVEFVREPDEQLGYLTFGLSMGQLLCIPMIAGGVLVYYISQKCCRKNVTA